MIRTKFHEIIGTKYPIIQAGMGPFSTNELCVASARNGVLGVISSVGMAPGVVTPKEVERVFGKGEPKELLKDVLYWTYENIKDDPQARFGVNIPVSHDFISPSKEFINAIIEVFEEKPNIKNYLKVIITSAGDPLPWAVNAESKGSNTSYIPIKENLQDIVWCHVCPSVRGAKRAERADVDIIIASGREGGAHCAWSDNSSLVLLPETVKQVRKPVIGTGGFSDGRSLAAALALGAIGIQMGTRFIATKESDFQKKWKENIVKSKETETIVGRGIFGPMRFIRNEMSLKVIDETLKHSSDLYRGLPCYANGEIKALEFEGFKNLIDKTKSAEESLILGGVVCGRINSIPHVKELIESIMKEAEEIIINMQKHVNILPD